jgi:hypothetical protein
VGIRVASFFVSAMNKMQRIYEAGGGSAIISDFAPPTSPCMLATATFDQSSGTQERETRNILIQTNSNDECIRTGTARVGDQQPPQHQRQCLKHYKNSVTN